MTRQIAEYLEAEDKEYRLCGFEGTNRFEPDLIGAKVEGGSTACYKGWYGTWRLSEGRLFLKKLAVYSYTGPPICGIEPEVVRGTSRYDNLMLPWGFTGKLTVIPTEDEERALTLHYCIAEKDEIVQKFVLSFDSGRLNSIENYSYLVQAGVDEDKPGKIAREGRIFQNVPTPFDHLTYKDTHNYDE